MSSKKIGAVTIAALLVLVASSMIASAEISVNSTFAGDGINATIEWNKTAASEWAERTNFPSDLKADIDVGNWEADYNVSVIVWNSSGVQAAMPIVFKVDVNTGTWNVSKSSANLNLWYYNSSGVYQVANTVNLSYVAYFIANVTPTAGAGTYQVKLNRSLTGDKWNITINLTFAEYSVDSISVNGNDLQTAGSNVTINAGDYRVYVNITGKNLNLSNSAALPTFNYDLALYLKNNFNVDNQTVSVSLNDSTGTNDYFLNYTTSALPFHTVTTEYWNGNYLNYTAYNITGLIKLKGNMTIPILSNWAMNVTPAEVAKWYITTPNGTAALATRWIDIKAWVIDQYGNINTTGGSYTGTLTFSDTSCYASDSSGGDTDNTVDLTGANKTKWIFIAGDNVTISIVGGGITASDSVTLYYYEEINRIELTFDRSSILSNNTDVVAVKAQIMDGDIQVKVKDQTIQLVESTSYGLLISNSSTGAWSTSATNNTDENGVATFYIKTSNTKAGEATLLASYVSGTLPGSATGSGNITIIPAVNRANTQATVYPAALTIVAGEPVNITLTLKDYAGDAITNFQNYGYKVEFNITGGDAYWTQNNEKVYVVTTDINGDGNASATLYTTNASSNQVAVTIRVYNESGLWDTVKTYAATTVTANVVDSIVVIYNSQRITSYAYPEGTSTSVQFTLQYVDAYGNENTSAGQIKIIPKQAIVGSFSTDTVNNGNTVTFTPNASAPVGASYEFTLNDSTYNSGNVTFTVAVSGIEAIKVEVNETYPHVGNYVLVTVQLLGIEDTTLAKPNVNLTMIVKDPDNIILAGMPMYNNTDANGQATFTFNSSKPGKHTIIVYNSTVTGINYTTFVGDPVKLLLDANRTTVAAGGAVEFTVKLIDTYGMPSQPTPNTVKVFVNDYYYTTVTLSNAVGTFNKTFDEAGEYNVYVYADANASLYNQTTITVTPAVEVVSVTVTPSEKTITVGDGYQFTATAEFSDGTTQDVTTLASWTSSNTTVGEVNDTGYFTALAEGTTYVNATYEGKTGSAFVTVTALLPSEEDTDNDNIPDWMEELFGTDPNTPDQPTEEQVIDAISDKVLEYYSPGVSPEEQAVILQQIIDMVDIYFDLF